MKIKLNKIKYSFLFIVAIFISQVGGWTSVFAYSWRYNTTSTNNNILIAEENGNVTNSKITLWLNGSNNNGQTFQLTSYTVNLSSLSAGTYNYVFGDGNVQTQINAGNTMSWNDFTGWQSGNFDSAYGGGQITIGNSSVLGCTDSTAYNYNSNANTDDGSCLYNTYHKIQAVKIDDIHIDLSNNNILYPLTLTGNGSSDTGTMLYGYKYYNSTYPNLNNEGTEGTGGFSIWSDLGNYAITNTTDGYWTLVFQKGTQSTGYSITPEHEYYYLTFSYNSGVLTLAEPYVIETCSDGIKNQDETSIDTGGVCDLTTHIVSTTPVDPLMELWATVTNGSDVVTNISGLNSNVVTGMQIQGTCIPDSTFVGTHNSDSIHLVNSSGVSVNATCSGDPIFISLLSVMPTNTSTFTAEVNVADSDYVDGMTFCMQFFNDGVESTGSLLDKWVSVAHDQCFDITQSGRSTFSSSSIDFAPFSGLSSVNYVINIPNQTVLIGWLLNDKVFLEKRVRFTIGQLSQWDLGVQQGNLGEALLGNIGVTKVTACGIATFDLGDCLKGLIVPSKGDLFSTWCLLTEGKTSKSGGTCDTQMVGSFKGILNLFPFGYITRFVTLMVDDSNSVMPPSLSYKFGTSSPTVLKSLTDNDPILINPLSTQNLAFVNSIESDQEVPKTIWQIIDPIFLILVQLAFLWAVFSEVLKMDFSSSSRGSRIKVPSSPAVDYSKMSDKEFQENVKITYADTEREYRTYKQF